MQYMGGKGVAGRAIARFIASIKDPKRIYVEPFCGVASVMQHIEGKRRGYDLHKALICTLNAWQDGWRPDFEILTLERYTEIRIKKDPTDPITAFVAHACSFAGKWFGRLAPDVYVGRGVRSMDKRFAKMPKNEVRFFCKDYRKLQLDYRHFIYADPPYRGTHPVGDWSEGFDTNEFWGAVRRWIKAGAIIVISETVAPRGFRVVHQLNANVNTIQGSSHRDVSKEVLWMHHSQLPKGEQL